MKKLTVIALVLLLAATLVLSACDEPTPPPVGGRDSVTVLDGYDYTRLKDAGITLYVHNWGEYIADGTDDSLDVNRAFEKLTGIKVEYILYDTNEALYAKFASGGFEGDVIIPSDYMAARLIAEGYVQKLDFANIPNYRFIDEKFHGLGHDPRDEYGVPYTWGVTGIVYNKTMVTGVIDSWNALWDETYKNNMLMFDNSRDAFGVSLLRLGYSVNTTNAEEINKAAEELKKQRELVQAYVMDQIFDKIDNGEAALAPYYNGDAYNMISENSDLAFVVPKEGTNYFVDCMMIPANAQNKEAAEMYINFMLEPQVGLENTNFICYSTPNTAVYELLDEDMKNDPVAYPSDEQLKNSEVFEHLPKETNDLIAELWNEIKTPTAQYAVFIILGAVVAAAVVILIVRNVRNKKKEY